MSTRDTVLRAAIEEARGLIGDAVDDRRRHPYAYFLFHRNQAATYAGLPGLWARWKARWHRQWRRHYWSKTLATREARLCAAAHPEERGA